MPETIGYKWISNRVYDVFIVRLRILDEPKQIDSKRLPLEWYSNDCIVEEISRLSDGKKWHKVSGGAYFAFDYEVGQRITGKDVCCYCRTMDELFESQKNGISWSQDIHKSIMHLGEMYKESDDIWTKDYLKPRLLYLINEMKRTDAHVWGPSNPEWWAARKKYLTKGNNEQ